MLKQKTMYEVTSDVSQNPKDITVELPKIFINEENIISQNVMSHSTLYREGVGYVTTYTWKIVYQEQEQQVYETSIGNIPYSSY